MTIVSAVAVLLLAVGGIGLAVARRRK